EGKALLAKLPPEAGGEAPGLRRVGDAFWITIPTFNLGDAKSGAALKALTEEVRSQASKIRSARAVVFDVRGNRGGNSTAGKALLAAIWPEAYIKERQPIPTAVDWRLSTGNIRFLRDSNLRTLLRQFGEESEEVKSYDRMLKLMEAALARGDAIYRDEPSVTMTADGEPRFRVAPILLTDGVCASACLDFADIVRRLPRAVHVGRETSADAVYTDNRALTLPSGLGFVGFSMKVYRGRIRGNNEPYRPSRVYPCDIRDTAAVEKWILAGL